MDDVTSVSLMLHEVRYLRTLQSFARLQGYAVIIEHHFGFDRIVNKVLVLYHRVQSVVLGLRLSLEASVHALDLAIGSKGPTLRHNLFLSHSFGTARVDDIRLLDA